MASLHALITGEHSPHVAKYSEPLLEGMLRCDAGVLVRRKGWVRAMLRPGHRVIGDGFDVPGPGRQRIIRSGFLQTVEIAQSMDPPQLMPSLGAIGARRTIAAQRAPAPSGSCNALMISPAHRG